MAADPDDVDRDRVHALVMGKLLAAEREERGISQADLAPRIGVGQATLSRIERGETQPDFSTLQLIAAAFGLSTPALVERIEKAIQRSRKAVEKAVPGPKKRKPARSGDDSWWETAVAAAGLAGLAGIIGFAIAALLNDEK